MSAIGRQCAAFRKSGGGRHTMVARARRAGWLGVAWSRRSCILRAMSSADVFRVAWYRFRCTWGERWTGYLALVLLIGLVGGLAIGSLAAARRTQAAFPAYLASTNPSDLTVLSGLYGVSGSSGYDPARLDKLATLPHVR